MKDRTIVLERSEATDRAVAAVVYRHIGDSNLEKVEVRYSTRAPAMSHGGIQHQLLELARRQPLPRIDLSCRAHDNYIDDATGETHIRVVYRPKNRNGVIRRTLARLKTLVGSGAPAAAEAIEEQAVVARIRAGLKRSAEAYLAGFRTGQAPPVAQVALVVREPQIDALMRRMSKPEELGVWLHRHLTLLAVPVTAVIATSYEFRPYRASEGTDLLGGGDLELSLSSESPSSEDRIDSPQDTKAQDIAAPQIHGDRGSPIDPEIEPAATRFCGDRIQGTLPPDWVVAAPYVVELEIEAPRPPDGKGRIRLDKLPARLDRSLLLEAGLGEFAPFAAQVASNQTPLEIDVTPAGRLYVNAGLRSDLRVPMYYVAGNEPRGIIGPLDLPSGNTRIVVNSPRGAIHPDRGHLDPIVVRLNVVPRAEIREAS